MLGKRALLHARAGAARHGAAGRRPVLRCPVRRRPAGGGHGPLGARSTAPPILTYTAVTGLTRARGRVTGALVRDAETGARGRASGHRRGERHRSLGDRIRRLEDPRRTPPAAAAPRASHVVVPREPDRATTTRITFTSPIDGRVMFVLPWGALVLHRHHRHRHVRVARTRCAPLPRTCATCCARPTAASPTRTSARRTWWPPGPALRPLIEDGAIGASSVSREHVIVGRAGGMVTVAGGKLTTYRLHGRAGGGPRGEATSTREARGAWPAEPGTDVEPLPGGESAEPRHHPRARARTRDSTSARWSTCSGTTAPRRRASSTWCGSEPVLARAGCSRDHPAIGAEVLHAARKEFARTVADVLVRRVHLFYETRDQGGGGGGRTAELLGRELRWTPARAAGGKWPPTAP